MIKLAWIRICGVPLGTRWAISTSFSSLVLYISTAIFMMRRVAEFPTPSQSLEPFSWGLWLLVIWLFLNILLASKEHRDPQPKIFMGLMIMLSLTLLAVFVSSQVLQFYVLFEIVLLPIFLIILVWGPQPERITAAIYIVFYTLTVSLPLLLILAVGGGFFIFYSLLHSLPPFLGFVITFTLVITFIVKFPIFLVHLWLPKAHVEAPVAGSIILAGVLLKLGGYGLWRLLWRLVFIIPLNILLCISIVGAAIAAVITITTTDLKMLVAYSSIVHIGVVIPCILITVGVGIEGAIVVILTHGICSSGLFAMVNTLYTTSKSRRVLLNQGSNIILGCYLLPIVFLMVFNFSVPPSISLWGEIELITRLVFIIPLNILLCISIVGARMLFCLFVISFIFHGRGPSLRAYSTYRIKESSVLWNHGWFFLFGVVLLTWLDYPRKQIVELWKRNSPWVIFFTLHFLFPIVVLGLVILSVSQITSTLLILTLELGYYTPSLVQVGVCVDAISTSFSSLVLYISTAIFIFALTYMNSESLKSPFMFILILFVVRMIVLVFSSNFITFILGWDGLGVTSYFLVIYYFSFKSLNSGILTAASNRLGDGFLLVFISLFLTRETLLFSHKPNLHYLPGVLVSATAISKSAQYPFCSWLPAAMAAPTPVRALVHSSTLVTAGVFMMIRFESNVPGITIKVLGVIAIRTILLARTSATINIDSKKIIALSTLRHLGVMMVAIGSRVVVMGTFHLMSHAMFKALLFMVVGLIIHSRFSNQDFRLLTQSHSSRVKLLVIAICCYAISGAPFTSGYFSKDVLLEKLYSSPINPIFTISLVSGVMLTILYELQLMKWILNSTWTNTVRESNRGFMGLMIMLSLTLLAVGGGFFIFYSLLHSLPPFLGFVIKVFIFSTLIVWLVRSIVVVLPPINKTTVNILNSLAYLNYLVTRVCRGVLGIWRTMFMYWDQGWNEETIAVAVNNTLSSCNKEIETLQTRTLLYPLYLVTAGVFMMILRTI